MPEEIIYMCMKILCGNAECDGLNAQRTLLMKMDFIFNSRIPFQWTTTGLRESKRTKHENHLVQGPDHCYETEETYSSPCT